MTTPKKDIVFPAADIQFDLSESLFGTIHRTSGVLKASDFSVIGDGSNLTILVGDKKNATSNCYETVVGETDKTFRANIKIENLKKFTFIINIFSQSSKNKLAKNCIEKLTTKIFLNKPNLDLA